MNKSTKCNWYRVAGEYTRSTHRIKVSKRPISHGPGLPMPSPLETFGKLAPATTLNDILEFLKPSFPEITGDQLTSRHPEQYASFRIDVYEDNVQKAMDPGLWPNNTRASVDVVEFKDYHNYFVTYNIPNVRHHMNNRETLLMTGSCKRKIQRDIVDEVNTLKRFVKNIQGIGTDSFAPSNLLLSSTVAGGAATRRETEKRRKYSELINNFIFTPVTIETSGTWDNEGLNFIKEIGQRISCVSQNPKSTAFLIQRISITLQRGNVASILGTLPRGMELEEIICQIHLMKLQVTVIMTDDDVVINRREKMCTHYQVRYGHVRRMDAGCEDITQCEVNVWLLSDDPELQMSDCDIVNAVLRPGDDADDTEVDTSEPEIDRVTADEGFKAFEVALRFVEQSNESTPADTMLIRRWRDIAARKRCEKNIQKKITDFMI
ncbi:hypothetical protein C0J52_12305 [Blattella germanica]|nr:hypothetical protein C0J52_12305 [Blattella germanica]